MSNKQALEETIPCDGPRASIVYDQISLYLKNVNERNGKLLSTLEFLVDHNDENTSDLSRASEFANIPGQETAVNTYRRYGQCSGLSHQAHRVSSTDQIFKQSVLSNM